MKTVTVRCKKKYFDVLLNDRIIPGKVYDVTEERFLKLVDLDLVEIVSIKSEPEPRQEAIKETEVPIEPTSVSPTKKATKKKTSKRAKP